jgi:hypothetical protein
MFIIFSLETTNRLYNTLLEPINAQSSIDSIRGVQNGTAGIAADKSLIVKLLADNLENRLNKSAAILEITSRLRDVKIVPYTDSVDRTLHGIPKDLDIPKRNIAQHILAADKDLEVIYNQTSQNHSFLSVTEVVSFKVYFQWNKERIKTKANQI